ncbi:heavy-metal-associated domain-containing protein [Cytobacillus firmus]|uniref:Copper chaperone CopZ n=1 Tax=Cytobacillus firmus TaxID=1399 RepID=A0AA46P6D8_CYTFI|nr:heavy metal-associated domain-containing protein [Cytobacillus firmus]UYG98171.1 heavy-metal-associated domain-containing protein [Cytobacillus firmus]
MRKWLPFLAIIIIVSAISYSYLSSKETSINTEQTREIRLENGKSLALIPEEANLPVSKDEQKIVLSDLGMDCMSCHYAVQSTLKQTDGVKDSFVNLKQNRATVVYDPKTVSLEEIRKRITEIGFRVGNVKEVAQ